MFTLDIVLVMCAYVGAHLLRFEWSIPQQYLSALIVTLPLVVLVKIFFFFWFNLYRGMWRYTSLIDFVNVVKAVAVSSVSVILLILFMYGFVGFSRSVYIMDFVLTLCLVAGVRVAIRLYLLRDTAFIHSFFYKQGRSDKRLLLIGAGAAGEQILRELMGNQHLRAEAVGLLDDNAAKSGKSIHGVPVLGTVARIEEIDVDYDEILITCPSATGVQMKRIVAACEQTGKPFKTMPSVGEVINGRVSMKMVREVSMTDLLGREEVRLEEAAIKQYLLGKRVLVTGAGGSIGSELVRQIARFRPVALALADVSEFNLYQVEMECRERFRGRGDGISAASVAGTEMEVDVAAYLVDLGDLLPTQRMFADFRPDVVFHAAAFKHVPLQELNPWETVYNNLLTMRNLIACSTELGVDKFVLVSTDKAVRPTNVMGATKRVCEMMAAAACSENRDSGLFEQRMTSEKQAHSSWFIADREKETIGDRQEALGKRIATSNGQQATSDLPLPPPEGDSATCMPASGGHLAPHASAIPATDANTPSLVIPAQAGIQEDGAVRNCRDRALRLDGQPETTAFVIPAEAGIKENEKELDSGFRRNDKIVGFMWLCKRL